MKTDPPIDTPEPTVLVRMLESVGPTATDRQRYEAGTEWLVPISRAEALLDAGHAELRALSAPSAPVVDAPAVLDSDFPEE